MSALHPVIEAALGPIAPPSPEREAALLRARYEARGREVERLLAALAEARAEIRALREIAGLPPAQVSERRT